MPLGIPFPRKAGNNRSSTGFRAAIGPPTQNMTA